MTSPLQDLCSDLHQKIGVVDETRYDFELKVARNEKEVNLKSQNRQLAEVLWPRGNGSKRNGLPVLPRSSR